MKKVFLPLLLLVASTSFGQIKPSSLPKEMIPIQDVDPSLSHQELTPMMTKIFEGTSILGVGENVHGSKQILQMQLRLIQNAVKTQGVRTIFWESNLFATRDLNQYLKTCEGNLPSILARAHSWSLEDEINTMNWLCQFNQSHPKDPVQIFGVDIYNFSELNHQWVINKIAGTKHADQIKTLLNQTHGVCVGHGKSRDKYMEEIFAYYYKDAQMSPINFEVCNKKLGEVLKLLQTNNRIIDQWTDVEQAEMNVYVRNLLAMQWYWLNRFSLGDTLVRAWKPRDSAMAENVMEFWRSLGKPKSIFMAHTSHVAKFHAPFIQTDENLPASQTEHIYPAGTYLREKLGSLYKVIGFTGYDNDGPQGDFATPTSKQSLDLFIQKFTQIPVLWIDLVKGSSQFDKFWWLQHENGGKDAFKDGVWMNPTDHYDALIYVERSEVSKEIESEPTEFEKLIREPVGPRN